MVKYKIILLLLALGISWGLTAQNEALHRANTEFEMMVFEDAIQSYEQHLEQHPLDKDVMLKIAECYYHLNQLEEALLWYNQALVEGVSIKYLLPYGKILMRLGRYEEAKEQFVAYAEMDKNLAAHYGAMCEYAEDKMGIPPLYKVSPLSINTPSADFSPSFFKGTLVFASCRDDIPRTDATSSTNAGKGRQYNHLYRTGPNTEGGLLPPRYLRSWFQDNNGINEGPVSYSADGEWVAFVKNRYEDGVSQMSHELYRTDIFIAKARPNGDWEAEESFPHNGHFSNAYPYLSADGNVLYFASNRPGGEGGFDIYMSEKVDGKWTIPQNLGTTINKPGDEISPYLDGRDLYFSSDYQMGFGGQDIFLANFVNGEWQVRNLGMGINSSANDFGFIFDKSKNIGFIVSDREGSEDIYQIVKTSDDINIVISDATTGVPIYQADLDFSDCGKGVYKSNDDGRFGIKASAKSLDCKVTVSKEGYDSQELHLNEMLKMTSLVEVRLYRAGHKYEGLVIDGVSNEPIPDVKIKVIDQTNGMRSETSTNAQGIYSLGLQPETGYLVKFSRMGYTDVILKENTKDGSDKSIFGTLLLYPANGAADNIPQPTEPFKPEVVEEPYKPVIPDDVVVENAGKPTPPSDGGIPKIKRPTRAPHGYAVQLVSLSINNTNRPDIRPISDIGRIYTTSDGVYRRYRVGVYETKEEANAACKVLKEKGYPKAYVVKEDASGSIRELSPKEGDDS